MFDQMSKYKKWNFLYLLFEYLIDTRYKIKTNNYILVKSFLISGLVDDYRIKTKLFAISPSHAIKVFQQKYPKAEDIYVIQNLFNNK